ncbi:hypothetical protein PR048_029529 [Dryococelus australis]|uniref:Uncharacterized protein n=1 Tax=Dryococelus australis TaxID=614101 RepID=A0ABQ9GFU4_9NEOP|nr:hypothetical protein PR048_029529 [Dryococelus australis]
MLSPVTYPPTVLTQLAAARNKRNVLNCPEAGWQLGRPIARWLSDCIDLPPPPSPGCPGCPQSKLPICLRKNCESITYMIMAGGSSTATMNSRLVVGRTEQDLDREIAFACPLLLLLLRRSGFNPRPGHSDFRIFLGDPPFPPPLHSASITHIGSRDHDIPEKTCRPAASSGTIPTCGNPGVESGWPSWEARSVTTTPPRHLVLLGLKVNRSVDEPSEITASGRRNCAPPVCLARVPADKALESCVSGVSSRCQQNVATASNTVRSLCQKVSSWLRSGSQRLRKLKSRKWHTAKVEGLWSPKVVDLIL